MTLRETIFRRSSVRAYAPEPLPAAQLKEIGDMLGALRPLDASIRVRCELLPQESVRTFTGWRAPHWIAVYSDEKGGWLENVGFMLQQADLWLQSRGLGSCWVGMGRPKGSVEKPLGMEYAIMLAVGMPARPLYRRPEEFRRKPMEQITDRPDERLEPARLAPSSTNSQPWYFTHDADGMLHVYRTDLSLLARPIYDHMNRIDIGIALSHLCIAEPERFRCCRAMEPKPIKGRQYVCSLLP